jgi:hypothetical protein
VPATRVCLGVLVCVRTVCRRLNVVFDSPMLISGRGSDDNVKSMADNFVNISGTRAPRDMPLTMLNSSHAAPSTVVSLVCVRHTL